MKSDDQKKNQLIENIQSIDLKNYSIEYIRNN